MSAIKAYGLVQSMKLHFSKDDYSFSPNGIYIKPETFSMKKDQYAYGKLAQKFKTEDALIDYIIPIFFANPKAYVRELFTEDAREIYSAYQKRKESLAYIFESDIQKLFNLCQDGNYDRLIRSKDGSNPLLLVQYYQKKIIPETLIILDMLTPFFEYWSRNLADPLIWPKERIRLEKYRQFLSVNTQPYRQIIKKAMNDN